MRRLFARLGIEAAPPAFHLVPVGQRLSDVVPTAAELEATARLQEETAAMLKPSPSELFRKSQEGLLQLFEGGDYPGACVPIPPPEPRYLHRLRALDLTEEQWMALRDGDFVVVDRSTGIRAEDLAPGVPTWEEVKRRNPNWRDLPL